MKAKMAKKQSFSGKLILVMTFIFLLLYPILVSSSCKCVQEEAERKHADGYKYEALKYKLVAIGSILFAGSLGVSLPFLVRNIPFLHPDNDPFYVMKAFAAGVILATGFVHILPDAFDALTSPCLGESSWHGFPFAGFIAMLSATATMMMESIANGYHKRTELGKARPLDGDALEHAVEIINANHGHDHTGGDGIGAHGPHGHFLGSTLALETTDSSQILRHRIVSQILEVGILVHSVIIGLSLGASQSPKTVKPLVAALSFHQFFEGMGLGGCIARAKFKARAIAIMVAFFSLTTPVGIAVGIGVSSVYKQTSPTAMVVQGVLNSASAGILIYMALVDLLAADFMNPKMLANLKLQLWANFALLLGVCCMSLLARLSS